MANKKCVECEERKPEETFCHVSRHAGGSYKRPGRTYSSSLCADCVIALAPRAANNRGNSYVGGLHWGHRSILSAARILGWAGPDFPSAGVRRLIAKRVKSEAAEVLSS